jgi:hypothetical protein
MVVAAARSRMGDGQLAGTLAAIIDDLRKILLWQVVAGDHDIGKGIDEGHRGEIVGFIRHFLIERKIEHEIAEAAHHQRVAVGRRRRGRLGADQRSGAGPVFDEERLADLLAQLAGQHPADDVVGAAGTERHDDPDRTVRVGLRIGVDLRLCTAGEGQGNQRRNHQGPDRERPDE